MTLAIIPAREGSKRLPGKNLMQVGGVSLVGRAVRASRQSRHIDRIVVSTDSAAIALEGLKHGAEVPFLRKAILASDTASSVDVVLDVLNHVAKVEWVVLIQPTSPLRNACDIDRTIEGCWNTGCPSCITTTAQAYEYRANSEGANSELPKPNGAVYVANVAWLRETQSFTTHETLYIQMPYSRSIDIDTYQDLTEARRIVSLRGRKA